MPNEDKGLEALADADFSGGFNTTTTECTASECYRTGFVIKHADYQIMSKSKLHTEILLSTAKVDCTALSTTLREAVPTIHLY